MTITQPSILSAKSADWQSLAGLTKIAGMDIDGREKKRGWTLQDWTMTDWTLTDWTMEDRTLTDWTL